MRVTNQLLQSVTVGGITRNSSKMLALIEQGDTGLRINRPSNNPIGYSIARRYDKQIQQNERFLENNAVAKGWLDRQGASITEFKKVYDSAFVLLEQAANGTTTTDEMDIIAYELRQMLKQLVSVGNNNFNGDYVFGGVQFDKAPYKEGAVAESVLAGVGVSGVPNKSYTIEAPAGATIPDANPLDFTLIKPDGTTSTITLPAGATELDLDSGAKLTFANPTTFAGETITVRPAVIYTGTTDAKDTFKIEIMEGQTIEVSGVGGLIFGGNGVSNAILPENSNAFEVLSKMIFAIESHDRNAISNMLAPTKEALTHIVNYQATVGGRINRNTLAEEMVKNSTSTAKDSRSDIQDVNVPTLLEDIKNLEVQYQMAVTLFSRVQNMNILNYL